MDSIALSYWKRPAISFTIDYGQKAASSEIRSARQVSKELGIMHNTIKVDCSQLGSGDMGNDKPLSIAPVSEWWPFRNQLLITLGCMKGVKLGIKELLLGSVLTDASHKDGTGKFYNLLAEVVEFQEGAISVKCPALGMSTIELIKKANVPPSILLWAHSCHTSNQPCMHCNGCRKYLHTLQQLGID